MGKEGKRKKKEVRKKGRREIERVEGWVGKEREKKRKKSNRRDNT